VGQIAPTSELALPRRATREWASGAGRVRLARAAAGVFAAVAVVGTAAPQGGYFPTSWGWIALGLGAAAVLARVHEGDARLGGAEIATLALLGGFVCWVALSAVWSQALPATIQEVERDLIYPLGLLAALLLARRGARPLLAGTLAGVTLVCAYALGTRLLPERLGTFDAIAGYRLSTPVGYWNALGAFAALGFLLAVGLAVRAWSTWGRMLAAAALPVLLPTLYFTFSRGSWIALAFGVLVALVVDPRRLQLATAGGLVAAPAAVAVWLGSRSPALTHQIATPAQAEHDGHRLLLEIVALAACAAALALLLALAERSLDVGSPARRAWAALLLAAVVAAVAAGVAHEGGPTQLARRAWHSFTGPPVGVTPNETLTNRLFTLSNNGRIDLWRVAWREYRAHPVLGTGAGTYYEYWLRDRPYPAQRKNAHSLYLEVLAELGPVGLALLVAALLVPLAVAVRTRGHPLVPAAAGAYGVYLLHAAGDWDWQIVGLTFAALLCAAGILRVGRGRRAPSLGAVARSALAVVVLGVVAFALVAEIGNSALASAGHASADGSWRAEESRASRAAAWAPWSSEALRLLAEAQYSLGRSAQARDSLRGAIRLDPRNWQLWLDLAVVDRGRARRAALARALRLDPLSPEIAGSGLPLPRHGGSGG
jgi:O-antigen ligase